MLTAILATACSDETGQMPVPKSKEIVLELNTSEPGNAYPTKGYDDTLINELDVLIFRRGESDDVFYGRQSFSANEMTDVSRPEGLRKSISINLPDEIAEEGVRLMAIANSRIPLNEFSLVQTTNRKQIHEELVFDYKWGSGEYPFSNFPMCGISEYLYPSPDGEAQNIKLDMYRSMARIDIGVDIKNNSGVSPLRERLRINRVGVFGTYDAGRIVRYYDEPVYGTILNLNLPPDGYKRLADYRHWYTYVENEGKLMTQAIYVPESYAFNNTELYPLVVITEDGTEAELVNTNGSFFNGVFLVLEVTLDGVSQRYFRVDFKHNDRYIPLMRNNRYEINITEVAGDGYGSDHEAINSVNTRSSRSDAYSEITADIKIYSEL